MPLDPKKYLYDIHEAASRIVDFTSGKTLDDYRGSAMLRSAVERQFEIIGEALAQLAKLDDKIVARISEYRRIIGFRNILILDQFLKSTSANAEENVPNLKLFQ